MKRIAALATTLALVCSCNAKDASTVEKDFFTATQVACIVTTKATSNAEIAAACGIADALIPSLETILSAHREGVGVPKPASCAH